ncbi:MAG: aromatic ring-hydroxylating dioxygenase subunit alpha [Archangiaceae bacterium]|nr:aromatic ring-hydroxylating dioxygenase subunit alpha [Archangiaceae bacterium]
MFEGFANVWTPVTVSQRLKKKPLAVQVAGEKLVLFRTPEGAVKALVDRCPHRGVALSLGRVTADGCLECPFHAWKFDGQGQNCGVPLNPDAKRERLFATPVPARALGGLLWVFTAPVAEAPHEPEVPETLTRPGLARTYLEVEWKAHWTRAMENMLDTPHVPFLHRRTIGRFVRPYLKADSSMDIEVHDEPYGFRTRGVLDRDTAREVGHLDFYRPNIMVLHIPTPNHTFRMHAICVPQGPLSTRMIVVGARSFARLPLLNPLFNYSNLRIVREDQAVVESSQPPEVPAPADERSVRTDRATLQFRRYYFDVLQPSSAQPAPRLAGVLPKDAA